MLLDIGPPKSCQLGLLRSVVDCTWYGGVPPDQLSDKFPPSGAIVKIIGTAPTAIFIVAVPDRLPTSETLTTKLLLPISLENGVPESVPLGATASQFGPLIFANVRTSLGFGSD